MENIKDNHLDELEKKRQLVKKNSRILLGIAALFIVIAIIILFVWMNFSAMLLFIASFILIAIAATKQNNFKKEFKSLVVTSLIKQELGENVIYNAKGGIDIKEINSLKVAQKPDRYNSEDYISTTYNGIPYEMCDYKLEERVETVDSHGNVMISYDAYFKGRIIKIDFKRELNMELKVVDRAPKGFSYKPLLKFDTEVIDFNKKFKCYASSQEDAFYLLTPKMIQKMLELEKLYVGGICYVVMNNNFYVLINGSDSLEVNISKPIDDKQLSRLKSDILVASAIINEFGIDKDKFNRNFEE